MACAVALAGVRRRSRSRRKAPRPLRQITLPDADPMPTRQEFLSLLNERIPQPSDSPDDRPLPATGSSDLTAGHLTLKATSRQHVYRLTCQDCGAEHLVNMSAEAVPEQSVEDFIAAHTHEGREPDRGIDLT